MINYFGRNKLCVDKIFLFAFLSTASLFVYGFATPLGNFRISRVFLIILMVIVFFRSLNRRSAKLYIADFWIFSFSIITFVFILVTYSAGGGALAYVGGLAECLICYYIFRYYSRELILDGKLANLYVWSSVPTVLIAFWQAWHYIVGVYDVGLVPFSELTIPTYDRIDSISAFGSAGLMGRLSGATNEPNVFGIYMASVCIVSYALHQVQRKKTSALFFSVSMILVVLSFSKSAFISLIIGFAYLNFRRFSLNLMPFIIILFLLIYLIFPEMFEARYSLDTIDSGHFDHRKEALSHIDFLGVGPGNYDVGSTHSLPLTLAVLYGAFGWILYGFLFVVMVWSIYISKRRSILERSFVAVLIAIFIGLNLYDYFIYYYFWVFLAVPSGFVFFNKSDNQKFLDDGNLD